MTQNPADAPAPPSDPPASSWMSWWAVIAVAVALAVVLRAFVVESFSIPSESMQNSLLVNDRVLVTKLGPLRSFTRGDVVVFDGKGTWGESSQAVRGGNLLDEAVTMLTRAVGGRSGRSDYVKRVIGVGGDRVKCCTANGRITVNGVAVQENYLFPGDKPSETAFDVVVPAGRLWMMGDHRSASMDSRAHLGKPGGGTIAEDDVIGPVIARFWPFDRAGNVPDAPQLQRIPFVSRS